MSVPDRGSTTVSDTRLEPWRSGWRWLLFAVLGCNAILGIEEATQTCGPCADGLICEQGTCVSALRPEDGPTSSDAGGASTPARCDRPDARYCLGQRRVVCGPDGLIVSSSECASQAHCQQAVGSQDCATCIPTCQGTRLSACRDGLAVAEQDCGADLCDTREGGRCLPTACTAGETACADRQFLRCDNGVTFTPAETCASAALCTLEGCRPAACEPGEARCMGATLAVCSEDRTGFVAVEQCASPALCDQQAGACRPPACAPGDATCTGATLRVCSEDRTRFTEQPCDSAELCDSAAGVCQNPTCNVGAGRCEGNVLFQCTGDPPRFERVDTCDGAELCDQTTGQCLRCAPNSQRCSEDGRARITCDASGLDETVDGCEMLLGLLGRCIDGQCAAL